MQKKLATEVVERKKRDIDGYIGFLSDLEFFKLGSPTASKLTTVYSRLVEAAADVASNGTAKVVMAWPTLKASPTGIVSLLALGAAGSTGMTEVLANGEAQKCRERADEVRVVIFPYARSTHAPARNVQVDRNKLGSIHFDHVKRFLNSAEEPAVKDYHQVLARVRTPSGRAIDGKSYAEFQHPVLDELVPHGSPNGERPSNSDLLWRTRNKTDIGKHARSGAADDASKAAYFAYTLRAGMRVEKELRAIGKSPDLLILDLTRAARNRLGWDWMDRAAEIIECMRKIHGSSGILVITDDPWTYRAARFELLGTRKPGRKGSVIPASGQVIFSNEPSMIQDDELSRSLVSQVDAEAKIVEESAIIMRSLQNATPMATMLEDSIIPALRASSKSIFIFRSDMVAEFAAEKLGATHPKLTDRIESGIVQFGGPRVLRTIAAASASARNQFKLVVLVAPTRPAILTLLAENWLPDNVKILADADTLAFAARDAARLADELKEDRVVSRLSSFASRANACVSEIGRHSVQLDAEAPSDDVEFPAGNVIDLSGGVRGDRQLIEISMHNGQRIIARKSTGIVLRDDGSATTSFIERPASQVRVGEEVCVIGPSFIERARTLVNIRATAAAEIRDYHVQVVNRFAEIPGSSVTERLREVASRMGEPTVSPDTARYWVDLDDEVNKSLHEVVPHAPQERETFMRFTAALGIGQKLAANFWLWAVVAQRSHRMRSGNIFHDAFRGILTDPHAALAGNSGRTADIRAIRSMAEEHVATVKKIKDVATS